MTARRMLSIFGFLVAFAACAGTASAMGSGSSSDKSSSTSNPDYQDGVKAIEAMDWEGAIKSLTAALDAGTETADVHNYLGFAYRKLGKLEDAFRQYEIALTIDPEHRGVHEYLGEAYLMAGKPQKAEEHLAKLDGLCLFGCVEYDQLKKAIAEYRVRHPGS